MSGVRTNGGKDWPILILENVEELLKVYCMDSLAIKLTQYNDFFV